LRVDVSGYKFTIPSYCACCHGQPSLTVFTSACKSTGKKVVHTTTKGWDIPYCSGCANHMRMAKQARVIAAWIVMTAFVASFFVWLNSSFEAGTVVTISGVALGCFAYSRQMRAAKLATCPTCTSVHRAVQYIGRYGTCHSFEITSNAYAMEFMRTNLQKLVNVAPETRQWLQQNGVAQPQAQQSPQRFMS
jgi:hypothetical protein